MLHCNIGQLLLTMTLTVMMFLFCNYAQVSRQHFKEARLYGLNGNCVMNTKKFMECTSPEKCMDDVCYLQEHYIDNHVVYVSGKTKCPVYYDVNVIDYENNRDYCNAIMYTATLNIFGCVLLLFFNCTFKKLESNPNKEIINMTYTLITFFVILMTKLVMLILYIVILTNAYVLSNIIFAIIFFTDACMLSLNVKDCVSRIRHAHTKKVAMAMI